MTSRGAEIIAYICLLMGVYRNQAYLFGPFTPETREDEGEGPRWNGSPELNLHRSVEPWH